VKPSDFAGENLKDMWLYLEPLVQELVSCDAYDHNLTDDLGEMLLTSGGTGPEVMRFHHGINKFLEEHQTGLEEIVFLAPKKQLAHMKEKKLMPSDLFRKVKEDYRKLYNSGKWAPSNNIKDLSGIPPAANMATTYNQPPFSVLQAAANALVQAMNKNNGKDQQPGQKETVTTAVSRDTSKLIVRSSRVESTILIGTIQVDVRKKGMEDQGTWTKGAPRENCQRQEVLLM
jgi:hypothetical protein